jgi:hypothetical protein
MGEFFLKWAIATVFMFVALPLIAASFVVGAAFVMWDAHAITYIFDAVTTNLTAVRFWLVVSAFFGLAVATSD